jgi:hypothetical protein
MLALLQAAHAGCSGDDSGGPDAADAICESAAACDPELVSGEECATRLRARLAAAPAECESCLQGLACDDWEQASIDLANVGTICPACSQNLVQRNLSIDLFWDTQPDSEAFDGGSCAQAGVDTMQWQLIDSDSGDVVAEDTEPCANGIDVRDPAPGEYELEISGQDEAEQVRWGATCAGLSVARPDESYRCQIPAQ